MGVGTNSDGRKDKGQVWLGTPFSEIGDRYRSPLVSALCWVLGFKEALSERLREKIHVNTAHNLRLEA